MGGKGGGKPTGAQGTAPDAAALGDALRAAEEFAALKL
jgi:alanyl-tRNA synthetase